MYVVQDMSIRVRRCAQSALIWGTNTACSTAEGSWVHKAHTDHQRRPGLHHLQKGSPHPSLDLHPVSAAQQLPVQLPLELVQCACRVGTGRQQQ